MRRLTVRIEDEVDQRLERLAIETNRTKSFYIREALIRTLDDMEDVYLADQVLERIRNGQEKSYSLNEVEAHLNLER